MGGKKARCSTTEHKKFTDRHSLALRWWRIPSRRVSPLAFFFAPSWLMNKTSMLRWYLLGGTPSQAIARAAGAIRRPTPCCVWDEQYICYRFNTDCPLGPTRVCYGTDKFEWKLGQEPSRSMRWATTLTVLATASSGKSCISRTNFSKDVRMNHGNAPLMGMTV